MSEQATMADDSTDPQRPAPEEVAARVAAILAAAQRDAREILTAARREVTRRAPTASAPAESHQQAGGGLGTAADAAAPDDPGPVLEDLALALESLAARLGTLEATTDARIDVLWEAVSPERGAAAEPVAASDRGKEAGLSGSAQPASEAPMPAAVSDQKPGAAVRPWAEPVRVIDLALRGYTRAQIANELGVAMSPSEVERLLGEVLERT